PFDISMALLITFFALTNTEGETSVYYIFLYSFLAMTFVTSGLGIACLIIGLLQMKKPTRDVYKTTMIIKCILIPYYIVNFVFGILMGFTTVLAIISMWLTVIGIFMYIILVLGVILTYMLMLATSAPNIGFLIYSFKTKKISLSWFITNMILQFFFVSDVVSSIMLYVKEKKRKQNVESIEAA
ncbi:MAG: hypothetical protein HUJ61_06835, partial [Bacilli bacterium]|nr:hypothetical protein [Bacilli bacterium]